MRRLALTVNLALGGLMTLGAATGNAYDLGGQKWPTRTITYHSAAPQYNDAIREAVKHWNTSGVNIRFKATARSKAKLRIVYGGAGGPSGRAVLGWSRVITFRTLDGVPISGGEALPCGAKVPKPDGGTSRIRCEKRGPTVWLDRVAKEQIDDPGIRRYMVSTVVHELGHSLGLKHQHPRCSIMSYRREETCPKPPVPWQHRCRLIESDDLKGALRRYGGTAKPLAAEFCESYAPPAAPTALAVTFDPIGRYIHASLVNGASPNVTGVVVTFKLGSCLVYADYAPYWPATPGTPQTDSIGVGEAGRYCVTAWSLDGLAQVGPSVSTWIDVPPA